MSGSQTSFRAFINSIGLDKSRAAEVQRLATIPDEVLTKRFREREAMRELTDITIALEWSRPFWKIKHRDIKHQSTSTC